MVEHEKPEWVKADRERLRELVGQIKRWRKVTLRAAGLTLGLAGTALITGVGWVGVGAVASGFGTILSFRKWRAASSEGRQIMHRLQEYLGPSDSAPPSRSYQAPEPQPGQLEDPEPAGPPSPSPVRVELDLTEQRSWATEDGRRLTLGPGVVEARFRLGFHPGREPEEAFAQDFPVLDTWVADPDGTWWSTSTFLHPGALTAALTPDGLPDSRGKVRFWSDAPAAWRRALGERCLLSGVRDLLDSRERFQLPVGDTEVTVTLKYQGPRLDVAWLEEDRALLVRAAGMVYEIWEGDEYREGVDQVCFGYPVDPSAILPITAPAVNWTGFEQWFERDEPEPPSFKPA